MWPSGQWGHNSDHKTTEQSGSWALKSKFLTMTQMPVTPDYTVDLTGFLVIQSITDNMAVDKFEKKTSLEISYFIRDIICQTMPSQYKLWCHGMPRFQMEPKSSPVLWKYSSKSLSSDSQSTLVELVACAWSSGSPSQACYTLQLVVLIESKRPGLPRHWALSAADVHIKYFPGPHRLHSEINFR